MPGGFRGVSWNDLYAKSPSGVGLTVRRLAEGTACERRPIARFSWSLSCGFVRIACQTSKLHPDKAASRGMVQDRLPRLEETISVSPLHIGRRQSLAEWERDVVDQCESWTRFTDSWCVVTWHGLFSQVAAGGSNTIRTSTKTYLESSVGLWVGEECVGWIRAVVRSVSSAVLRRMARLNDKEFS